MGSNIKKAAKKRQNIRRHLSIEVWAEGEIDIENDNLSAPESLVVAGQNETAQSISKDDFCYNELCLRRI